MGRPTAALVITQGWMRGASVTETPSIPGRIPYLRRRRYAVVHRPGHEYRMDIWVRLHARARTPAALWLSSYDSPRTSRSTSTAQTDLHDSTPPRSSSSAPRGPGGCARTGVARTARVMAGTAGPEPASDESLSACSPAHHRAPLPSSTARSRIQQPAEASRKPALGRFRRVHEPVRHER